MSNSSRSDIEVTLVGEVGKTRQPETVQPTNKQTSAGSVTNADTRQISETNTLGSPAASYFYDGAGQRVEKIEGSTARCMCTTHSGNWRLNIPAQRARLRA